jgi:hypothetical protein
MRIGRGSACVVLVSFLMLTGCGQTDKKGHVSGKVEVDGKPLEGASITFKPFDGNGPTAGGVIKSGQYSADVPVGNMKVSINQGKVVGKKKVYPTADSPEMPITKEALPARFNEKTELQCEVQPGENKKDFILSTK